MVGDLAGKEKTGWLQAHGQVCAFEREKTITTTIHFLPNTALAQRADAVFLYLPTDAAQTAAIKALTTAPRPKDRDPLALILLAGASAASLAAATKANKACAVATAHIVGGGDAARRLALLAFVAGPNVPKTIARTLLAPLCADAVDIGDDPAAGAALAAAAALLTAGLLEATAEAVAAAEAMRVPRARATVARLAAELAGGGAASFLGPAAAARRMADAASRPAPPDAAVAELVDAVKHGLAAAKVVKAPTPAAAAAAVHLQQVEESGGGHLDAAALVVAVRDAAGLAP